MQLFQEYIVGGVSHEPHLFNVNASDIKFLDQFESRFWVSALWERYNTYLQRALKLRQRERDKQGYREFLTLKYHDLVEKIKSKNNDYSEKTIKKLALFQATNLAEERFYHIQAKNTVFDMLVQSINYDEDSTTDRKIERKFFRANDFISDLIQDLEKQPLSRSGYDLTGLKEYPNVNTFTKSKYSTRGFQFPSKNTIREALRRWIEYTSLDFLHKPGTNPTPEEKKDYVSFKEKEIHQLHISFFEKIYEDFFKELSTYKTRRALTSFLNNNETIVQHIKDILTEHNIDTLSRSGLRMTATENPEDSIEFIKKQFLKLVSDATDETLFRQFKDKYIKNRRIGRFIVNLLAQIDIRLARINGTYFDPHNRKLGFNPDTKTDELFGPRVAMKKVVVYIPNELGETTPVETEVPHLVSGKLLHPIHNRNDLQTLSNAVGDMFHYDNLHLPEKDKATKIKPFIQIRGEDYAQYKLHPRDTIIGGGIIPNAKNSPKRRGFATEEERYEEELQKSHTKLNFSSYEIIKNVDGSFSYSKSTDSRKFSLIILNFLINKFKNVSRDYGQTITVNIYWKEWSRCMDVTDFVKLHDHIFDLLLFNNVSELKKSTIRTIMNRLFDRMSHLDFGCGTKSMRTKDCTPPYDCRKIKLIIDKFYQGLIPDGSEESEIGRKHDVSVRTDNPGTTTDLDNDKPFLQLYRDLVMSYKTKFASLEPIRASQDAELCASIFLHGAKKSKENINNAVSREISRLSIPSESANCQNVEKYNKFKEAYSLLQSISKKSHISINENQYNLLKEFTNESSNNYNKKIANIVETIQANTDLLKEFIIDLENYDSSSKVNLESLNEESNLLNTLKVFVVNNEIINKIKSLIKNPKINDIQNCAEFLSRFISTE